MDKAANRNTLYAYTLVDELQRAGLGAVVIAPGSRSTPLALAFGSQSGLAHYTHPDERGAAFFALGLALASGKPIAVLCTSGTAAANFFPAAVEAHMSQVPLILLTADRPPELRDSGANQTIDQVKLFSGYLRWSVEAPLPVASPPDSSLRALRSLANRLVAAATGNPPGPVHANLPFAKPLEPTPVPGDIPAGLWSAAAGHAHARPEAAPFVSVSHGMLAPTPGQITSLVSAIRSARRGLIVCGPRTPAGGFPGALYHLAELSGFPILADALSGLRFHPTIPPDLLLGGYDTFLKSPALRALEPPDLLLQFGALPISQSLNDLLAAWCSTRRIQVSTGAWADDAFTTTQFLTADPQRVVEAVLPGLQAAQSQKESNGIDLGWRAAWQRAERLAWQAWAEIRQGRIFEGAILADICDSLEAGDSLFVASSLPVRHLDQFGQPARLALRLFANRGASGIDGTIATAVGAALGAQTRGMGVEPDSLPEFSGAKRTPRMALVIGDLAFLHDLNSLLALRRYAPALVIVLLNNNGGGIFARLPIASYDPLFTDLFSMPHGLQFEHAARLFELEYTRVTPADAFMPVFRGALAAGKPHLIEVQTTIAPNEDARRAFLARFEQLWGEALR